MDMSGTSTSNQIVVVALGTAAALLAYYFMGGFSTKPTKTELGKGDDKGANKKIAVDSKTKENNSVDKFPAGLLTIYFGSQTGTAEGFARQLVKETKAKGFYFVFLLLIFKRI